MRTTQRLWGYVPCARSKVLDCHLSLIRLLGRRDVKRPKRPFASSLWPCLAHGTGVNSLICAILAAGKRVNKSFRYSKGLIPCRRQLPNNV